MARHDDTAPTGARTTYSLRLAEDERRLIDAAAAARGEPASRFVRRTAVAAARRELIGEARREVD